MRHSIPVEWEGLLKGYVKKTFYSGTRREPFTDRAAFTEGDYRFFATGVARLNAYFTSERGLLPKNYFNQKDLRSGYILYFLPVNALKVATLLQIPPGPPLSKGGGGDFTIIDVGSGPGTGMFGTAAFLERSCPLPPAGEGAPSGGEGRVRVRWILIDQNRSALSDAIVLHRDLVGRLRAEGINIDSELETIEWDLGRGRLPRLPRADLILALNLLGEFPRERRLRFLQGLMGYLKETGRMLVMEPALQRTTRELMELHDELLRRGSATVLAPCLHQAACPMLSANRRDWCHTYLEWERPDWIEKIDRLVGIRKDYLKCSYVLLGREAVAAVPPDHWRIVSGHLNSKGKSELLLCGPGGLPNLLRVTRLDRDRSACNSFFDQVERGDLVRMGKTDRIGKETALSKLTPPSGRS